MNTFILILLALIVAFIAWRFYFLRDPRRVIPHGNFIVAPADGMVLYIKKVEKGNIPFATKRKKTIQLSEVAGYFGFENTSGSLVGIFMTPMSVHRNRIPVSGEIADIQYQKKPSNLTMVQATTDVLLRRKSFPDYDFYLTNERLTIFIKTKYGIVSVTQIADKWIRKIVSWVEVGDKVSMGDQYGMIRFGSQCDVFLPETMDIDFKVKPGQYVYAGETILGVINENKSS